MHQPQQRASRLRVVALASTVALAVALPLAAAVAGEDARLASRASEAARPGPDGGEHGERLSGTDDTAERGPGSGSAEGAGRGSSPGTRTENGSGGDDGKPPAEDDVPELAERAGGRGARAAASSCGPEVAAPEGVEAQTCVLTAGEDTWARTYYRNATNGQLPTVLTLMRPDGRTVQMHCTLPAADEPGICETPRHSGAKKDDRAGMEPYSAVAEVASADGERRLLRSGSNSLAQWRS